MARQYETYSQIGQFKGNDMFQIHNRPEDDDDADSWAFKKPAFSFGRTKAKLIVEYFEEIKKFAESG